MLNAELDARLHDKSLQRLAGAVRRSYREIGAETLSVPSPLVIRAGIAGGLPFDSLSTDVTRGCLPPGSICYGGCFAATAAFAAGEDFGHRVANVLDPQILRLDLRQMPEAQRYVRNGWNGDPSWAWSVTVEVAVLMRESGRLPVLLTRAFRPLSDVLMTRLVEVNAELRLSLSAFDTQNIIRKRLDLACKYRALGGIAIPVVVTSRFKAASLNKWQEGVVREIVQLDLPGAENSLRFRADSPVAAELPLDGAFLERTSGDRWFGRLFANELLVPTITAVPPHYQGLQSGYLERLDRDELARIHWDPVPTRDNLATDSGGWRPREAGVTYRR